ncbi:MAG: peptidoglycan-binding protein [Clostridia bacterium]|nr:peptidoglycan-binding protein [Clostridia bacterium]
MKGKKTLTKWIAAFAAVCMMLFICTSAFAQDASSLHFMGAYANESAGTLTVTFRAQDASGAGITAPALQGLSFRVDGKEVPVVEGTQVNQNQVAYIFVLDRSAYYSQWIHYSTVQNVVSGVLAMLPEQSQVAILFTDNGNSAVQFMDKVSANAYLTSSGALDEDTSYLYETLSAACASGTQNVGGVPRQKVIVTISDGISQGSMTQSDIVRQAESSAGRTPIISIALYRSVYEGSKEKSSEQGRSEMIYTALAAGGFGTVLDTSSKDLENQIKQAVGSIASFTGNVSSVSLDIRALYDGAENYAAAHTLSCMSHAAQAELDSMNVLFAAGSLPAPTPEPTAEPAVTPEPTPAPTEDPVKLTVNTSSSDISYMKKLLADLYYFEGNVNSEQFDAETMVAVNRFCDMNGLAKYEDGIGVAAWNTLVSGYAVPNATATPDPEIFIHPGADSADVRQVQFFLRQLYYAPDTLDSGVLDTNTQLALDEFNRRNGLPVRDGVTHQTWNMLISGTGVAAPTATPEPTATPAPTATPEPTPEPRDATIKFLLGDSGEEVTQAKYALANLYYMDRNMIRDNVFDTTMWQAVNAFCSNNGLQPRDGMSVDAWTLLMLPGAIPAATATPAPTATPEYIDLEPMQQDEYVSRYQLRLKETGYLTGEYQTGTFDEATQAAQDLMCKHNGFSAEKGASVALQGFVFSDTIKDYNDASMIETLRRELVKKINIASLAIPVWVLCSFGVVLCLALVLLLILFPKGKKGIKAGKRSKNASQNKNDAGVEIKQDPVTEDFGSSIVSGKDLPTSVNVNGWHITLSVTYMGTVHDYTYTMEEYRPLTIGRGSDRDVILNQQDLSMSRQHGEFICRGGELYYADTSSAGTYVNGEMVKHGERMLQSGSELLLGKHRVVVVLG